MKHLIILFTLLLLSGFTYAQISISGQTTVCPGNTYPYTVTHSGGGIGMGVYIWTLNGLRVGNGNIVNPTIPSGLSSHVLTVSYVDRRAGISISTTIYLNNPYAGAVYLDSSPTVCYGGSASIRVGQQRLGPNGSGTFQKRTASTWQNISTPGTSINVYNLTSDTDFRYKISNSCGTQYSNIVSVDVKPPLNPGGITNAQTVCYGGNPSTLGSSSSATNGIGGYSYQWQHKSASGSWGNISGANSTTYNPPVLTSTRDYRRRVISCGQTKYTNTIRVTVKSPLTAGSIGNAQSICYGGNPSTLSNASSPTNGLGGYNYQWQHKSASGSWGNISGATSSTYNPPILTSTRDYRRRVTSCGQTKYTSSIRVSVKPPLTPGAVNNAQTICYGGNPSTLGSSSGASNGLGGYSYQWQQKSVSGSWGNISGATSTTYNPSTLTSTRDYRRRVISCGQTKYSNTVRVTVRSPLQGGTITGNQTICEGDIPNQISNTNLATNGTKYTYKWEFKTSSTDWTLVANQPPISGSSLQPEELSTTTMFRRKVTSCDQTAYSTTVTVTVNNNSNVSIGANLTAYEFESAVPLQGTGESPSGGSYSGDYVSNNHFNATQSGIGVFSLTYSYTNSNGCSSEASKTIEVLANPILSLTGSDKIALGESRNLSVTNNFTSYQWYRNGQAINGANGHIYTAESAGNYHVLITANSGATLALEPIKISNITADQNENMIYTRMYKQPTKLSESSRNINEENSQITFFDGLGRQVQTIMMQASPDKKDLVSPIEYDARGNITKKYLPYEENQKDGQRDYSALRDQNGDYDQSNQYGFYASPPNDEIASTVYPYQEVVVEKSPLKRPLAQYSAGDAWAKDNAGGGAPTTTQYLINGIGDAVIEFKISNDSLTKVGQYPVNSLEKTVMLDENENKTIGFTNSFGQEILKRSYTSPTSYIDTYYIYDKRGNLRIVLPPMASEQFVSGNPTPSEKEALLIDYSFRYTYDGKNRMIAKNLPGVDSIYMIYDDYDRLILTQDGKQRKDSLYSFTKYDAMSRAVLTGVLKIEDDISDIRENVRLSSQVVLNPPYSSYESRTATGGIFGYSNDAYPAITEEEVLTVNYYDDYSFKTLSWFNDPIFDYADEQIANAFALTDFVKGQATGALTKVLNTNQMLASVNYYDTRYRLIQNMSESLDNKMIRMSNGYDFVGNIKISKSEYLMGAESHSITESYDYDHMDRLLKVNHQIDGEAPVVILENEYNKLGELITKNLHEEWGSFAQSVNYRYNSRGWITRINKADLSADNAGEKRDLFGMELGYTDDLGLSNPSQNIEEQYNGNIAAIKWSANQGLGEHLGVVNQRGYGFAYDGINRLTSALSHERVTAYNSSDHYNVNITKYDANGNIEELDRTDHKGEMLDELIYSYENSNQLQKVLDTGNKSEGFKDSQYNNTDYIYDDNGNMTSDANKGITKIHYNYLNLPDTVNFSNGNTMIFTYDAMGNKLGQQVLSDALNYTTEYLGALYLKNDTLQHINTAEGRAVPNTSGWEYQYFLKDHLGNVRTTFTTAPKTETYSTSFETATVPDSYFDNYQDQNLDNYLANTETYSSRLSYDDDLLIGLAKSLKVYPGDTVNATAFARVLDNSTEDASNLVAQLANGFANAFLNNSLGIEGQVSNVTDAFYPPSGVGGLFDRPDNDALPKVYLNLLHFDKDMNFITLSYHQTPIEALTAFEKLTLEYIVPQEGYVLIYLSNEEEQANIAYFDDVSIEHKHSAVIQEESYYPFGMSQHHSYQRELSKKQRYTYNGKESITDLDLGWLDYQARYYDPAIGRFLTVDPAADLMRSHSPYNYGFDNPIRFIDPDGMIALDVVINGDMAEEATAQLNASSELDITRDSKTGKLSATGEATTKSDKALLAAINDENITVNVNATSSNEVNIAGTEKDLLLGAYGGNTINDDGSITAEATFNPNQADVYADVYNTESGVVATHEILESYSAANESPGASSPSFDDVRNKTENGKAYLKAHKAALKLDKRYVDPTIIGDNSSGRGVYKLQQMRKLPGITDPFPFEKVLYKKEK